METDILEITTSLDQPLPVSVQKALDNIDTLIEEARKSGDPEILLQELEDRIGQIRISGMALCKLLYKARQVWSEFSQENDFEEVVAERIGLSATTVDRYATTWAMHENKLMPPKIADEIIQKPLRVQIPVAKMLEQGYKPDKKQWKELAAAPDLSTTAAVIREIKGVPPRQNSLMVYIDKKGNITATENDEIVDVGFLFFNDRDNPIIEHAIRRIINDARMIEKGG